MLTVADVEACLVEVSVDPHVDAVPKGSCKCHFRPDLEVVMGKIDVDEASHCNPNHVSLSLHAHTL